MHSDLIYSASHPNEVQIYLRSEVLIGHRSSDRRKPPLRLLSICGLKIINVPHPIENRYKLRSQIITTPEPL